MTAPATILQPGAQRGTLYITMEDFIRTINTTALLTGVLAQVIGLAAFAVLAWIFRDFLWKHVAKRLWEWSTLRLWPKLKSSTLNLFQKLDQPVVVGKTKLHTLSLDSKERDELLTQLASQKAKYRKLIQHTQNHKNALQEKEHLLKKEKEYSEIVAWEVNDQRLKIKQLNEEINSLKKSLEHCLIETGVMEPYDE